MRPAVLQEMATADLAEAGPDRGQGSL